MKATCTGYMFCQHVNIQGYAGKTERGEVNSVTNSLTIAESFYLHCIWYLWKSALSYNQSFVGFRFTLYILHIMYIIKNKGKKIGHETAFTLIQYWCKIWNWIDSSLLPSSICAVQQYPQCLVSSHQALQTQRRRTNRSGTHKWKMNMMIWYEKKQNNNKQQMHNESGACIMATYSKHTMLMNWWLLWSEIQYTDRDGDHDDN